VPAPVTNHQLPIQNPKSKIQNRKRKSPNLIGLAAISIGLALGCGWLLFSDDVPRLDKLELLALAQEPTKPSQKSNMASPPVGAQGLRPSQNPPIQNRKSKIQIIQNPKSKIENPSFPNP
jgi:hypothetical protein